MKQFKSNREYDKLIHQYLDNQLPNEKEQEFITVMDNNPAVKTMVENEQFFRSILKENIYKSTLSSKTEELIKKTFMK
ncbi:MAG: hypothetical protein KDC04_06420 [Saprospiraceae bacterium]|nr:hypothetical protein [Saprospiraceae bacterium]MCB9310484.1 hypothetical protein [Lewinellaceae bacterium]